jgi:hypothetical protein
MERDTASGRCAGNEVVGRRWLTLEQLLEVLPLKESYVYYLAYTQHIPLRRIGRLLLLNYDRSSNRL